MNQRTAEAMAERVRQELGDRATHLAAEHVTVGFDSSRHYWSVRFYVDRGLYLGFSEPQQWADLKARHNL